MNNQQNISPEEMELIGQWLDGSLSPEAAATFEQRMQQDADWKSKVDEFRLLKTGINESILRGKLESFHNNIPKRAPGKVVSMAKRVAAIAAILVAVVIGGWWLINNNRDDLYASYYKPDPGLSTAMSISNNYVFEKAMVDYKKGNYIAAITAWDTLYQSNPSSDTLQYFLAMAYQANNDLEKAAPLLATVTADKAHSFYKEACWYYGLLLIKQDKKAAALPYFNASDDPRKAALLKSLE